MSGSSSDTSGSDSDESGSGSDMSSDSMGGDMSGPNDTAWIEESKIDFNNCYGTNPGSYLDMIKY